MSCSGKMRISVLLKDNENECSAWYKEDKCFAQG